jgi:CP family cyanate transporter-like MFS transporter
VKRASTFWVLAAIFVTALIIRPPVAQIGPVLEVIQKSLGLDNSQSAILAAIPVLCFGFGAFASPALVRRFGINRTMVFLLTVLFIAIAVRPYVGFIGLLIGTTLAGLAMAVANVLLPSVVRARFPNRVAILTSAYTTLLAVSASFAAAFSYPSALAFGWQLSLAIWALPTLLALMLSFSLLSGDQSVSSSENEDHAGDTNLVLRSPLAWAIIVFFGFQSLGFYALLAWLPSIAIEGGMNPTEAGALLSLMTIVGVPLGLLLSSNYGRFRSLSLIGTLVSLVTLAGICLLLLELWVPAAIVIGIGQAASFPLGLSLISTRAANQRLTTMLSSISQGVGYLIAAAGTFLFGWFATVSGNWQLSVLGLIALTLAQSVAAWFAGSPKIIK